MNLNGWTKVGDKTSPTGKWVVYRYKGREFDDVDPVDSFPDEAPATSLFAKTKDSVKRGGLWLVAPDGTVKDLRFVRPY